VSGGFLILQKCPGFWHLLIVTLNFSVVMYVIVCSSHRQCFNFRTFFPSYFWLLKLFCNIISITVLIVVVVINRAPEFWYLVIFQCVYVIHCSNDAIYSLFWPKFGNPFCHWGHMVMQLVEALRYKPEGGGFNSQWGHWLNPSVNTMALGSTQRWVPGTFPGGKGGWCVGLTSLPSSCADYFEIWEPRPLGTVRACLALQWDNFTFLPLLLICPLFYGQ
jgi:hypothetical protein